MHAKKLSGVAASKSAAQSQSFREYGMEASAAAAAPAAHDHSTEQRSSRTHVAPFSRQGSDGVQRAASTSTPVESTVPPLSHFDEGGQVSVTSSKSKSRSKVSAVAEAPAAPVAAAAGDDYDDWDAADAPAADVVAVSEKSEKKKKVNPVVFSPPPPCSSLVQKKKKKEKAEDVGDAAAAAVDTALPPLKHVGK